MASPRTLSINMVMVRWVFIGLLACILAQIIGLITVFISMHLLVVPRFDGFSKSWKRTRCYVRNITLAFHSGYADDELLSHSGGSSVGLFKSDGGYYTSIRTYSSSNESESSEALCARVYVDYEDDDHELRPTFLYRRGAPSNDSTDCFSVSDVSINNINDRMDEMNTS